MIRMSLSPPSPCPSCAAACAPSSWWPALRRVTIRSVFIPLPPSAVSYLLSDDSRLPRPSGTADALSPGDPRRAWLRDEASSGGCDGGMFAPGLPLVEEAMRAALASLGGSALPKLGAAVPLDAAWAGCGSGAGGGSDALRCVSPGHVWTLLKASDLAREALVAAAGVGGDRDGSGSRVGNGGGTGVAGGVAGDSAPTPPAPVLTLRRWRASLTRAGEVRVFVRARRVVAMCQRHCSDGPSPLLHHARARGAAARAIVRFLRDAGLVCCGNGDSPRDGTLRGGDEPLLAGAVSAGGAPTTAGAPPAAGAPSARAPTRPFPLDDFVADVHVSSAALRSGAGASGSSGAGSGGVILVDLAPLLPAHCDALLFHWRDVLPAGWACQHGAHAFAENDADADGAGVGGGKLDVASVSGEAGRGAGRPRSVASPAPPHRVVPFRAAGVDDGSECVACYSSGEEGCDDSAPALTPPSAAYHFAPHAAHAFPDELFHFAAARLAQRVDGAGADGAGADGAGADGAGADDVSEITALAAAAERGGGKGGLDALIESLREREELWQ